MISEMCSLIYTIKLNYFPSPETIHVECWNRGSPPNFKDYPSMSELPKNELLMS